MKRVLFAVMMILASGPVWMMVVHEVEDYDHWRSVFDSGLSARRSAGELHFEINRYPDYPNQIIGTFQWDTTEWAQAFVDSPTVRNTMKAAGVISDPIVTFYEGALRYDGG